MAQRIGEILVAHGAVTAQDVERALQRQRTSGGRKLGEILVAAGKVQPEGVARALAEQFELPFVQLPEIPSHVSALLPLEFQTENRIVPFKIEQEGRQQWVHIALADPTRTEVMDEIRFQMSMPIKLHVAASDDLEGVLAALAGGDASILELEEEAPAAPEPGPSVIVDMEDWSQGVPPSNGAPASNLMPAAAPSIPAPSPPAPKAKAAHAAGETEAIDVAVEDWGFDEPAAVAPAAKPVPMPKLPTPIPIARGATASVVPPAQAVPISKLPTPAPAARPAARASAPTPAPASAAPRAAGNGSNGPARAPRTPVPSQNLVSPVALSAPLPVPGTAASGPKRLEISEADLKVLDSLERLASGENADLESSKVRPPQMVASLIRLLIKKGVIREEEFLEELGRK